MLLAVILGLGLGLRLWNLGVEPYWGDEALSLDIARSFTSLREMLTYIRAIEFHPPLYYILLYFWTDWFGVSEFAVRILSVLFGLGCVLLVYGFANRLFANQTTALLAAFITAILPFQIEFSQEARPYIIFCFFGILSAWAAWEYQREHKTRFVVGYIISSVIGLYLHYSFFLIVGAICTWWLFRAATATANRSRGFIIWLAVHAMVFLGFAPWLEAFIYKIAIGQMEIAGLHARRDAPLRPPIFFEHALDNLIWLTKTQILNSFVILAKWAFKLFAVVLGLEVLRRRIFSKTEKESFIFLVWLAVATLILYLFAPFSGAYTVLYERHLIFLTVLIALTLAFVARALKWKKAAILVTIFTLSLVPFIGEIVADDTYTDPEFQMKGIAEFINEQYKPGDLVIVPLTSFRTDAAHYLREEIPVVGLIPPSYYGNDFYNTRHTLGFIENEFQSRNFPVQPAAVRQKLDYLIRLNNPPRVWLFAFLRSDEVVYDWFRERNYRHGVQAFRPLFDLDMFARREDHAVQK